MTIRMGFTKCHLTCTVSAAATQRQIVLYYDVVTHQCAKKRGIGIKLLLTVRTVMLKSMWIWLLGTSTVPLGAAAHGAAVDDSPVLLKKPSPIRTYRCHLAPHRCGDQVQCSVNGLMYVISSSHRISQDERQRTLHSVTTQSCETGLVTRVQ